MSEEVIYNLRDGKVETLETICSVHIALKHLKPSKKRKRKKERKKKKKKKKKKNVVLNSFDTVRM